MKQDFLPVILWQPLPRECSCGSRRCAFNGAYANIGPGVLPGLPSRMRILTCLAPNDEDAVRRSVQGYFDETFSRWVSSLTSCCTTWGCCTPTPGSTEASTCTSTTSMCCRTSGSTTPGTRSSFRLTRSTTATASCTTGTRPSTLATPSPWRWSFTLLLFSSFCPGSWSLPMSASFSFKSTDQRGHRSYQQTLQLLINFLAQNQGRFKESSPHIFMLPLMCRRSTLTISM